MVAWEVWSQIETEVKERIKGDPNIEFIRVPAVSFTLRDPRPKSVTVRIDDQAVKSTLRDLRPAAGQDIEEKFEIETLGLGNARFRDKDGQQLTLQELVTTIIASLGR